MDFTLKPLFFALPLLVLVAAIEGWYLQRVRRQAYDWRAFFASLGDAVGRRLILSLLGTGVVGVLLYWVWEHRINTIPMDRAWSWVLLFVGQEFCYYWMHRADHRIRWLWATHAVHHSPNQFNLSAAYRLGWTAPISGAALFFDYGHGEPKLGSTLQAVRAHRSVDPFAMPGEADLTDHVDFSALSQIAKSRGARWLGTPEQGRWLRALGIEARADALAAFAPQHAEALQAAKDRLIGEGQMGVLFKVMGLAGPRWPEGAGF